MRKGLLAVLFMFCAASRIFAAIPGTAAWNVQASGCNDAWGGGFDTARTGADYSTRTDSPQISINNSAVTATVTASTITFTGGYTPAAADAGNIVNLAASTGGTAPTYGRYVITGYTGNTWTLDRSTGASGATITAAYMGGCLATVQTALAAMVADNTVWIKNGTYNLTTGLSTQSFSAVNYSTSILGYNTTRGDTPAGSNRPVIATNGNGVAALSINSSGWRIANLIFDGAENGGTAGTTGVQVTSSYNTLVNLRIANFSNDGVAGGTFSISNSEVTNTNQGAGTAAINFNTSSSSGAYYCWVHDNLKNGIGAGGSGGQSIVIGNVVTNNNGYGVLLRYGGAVLNNVIYGNTGDGINGSAVAYYQTGSMVMNNIIANNSGYAINANASAIWKALRTWDYNATWNNRGSTAQAAQYNNLAPGAHDINVTASPFVNAAASGEGDWSLNNNSPGGMQLRAAGFPGLLPGLTAAGKPDIGSYQHGDPACASAGGAWVWGQ